MKSIREHDVQERRSLGLKKYVWNCALLLWALCAKTYHYESECGNSTGRISRVAKQGGFKRGGFPDLDSSVLLCPFFVLCGTFPISRIFPICSGMVRGLSRFVLCLLLGLLQEHPRVTVPKGSATQSGPFPKKVENPPGLETPQFSFSQELRTFHSIQGNFFGCHRGTKRLPVSLVLQTNYLR